MNSFSEIERHVIDKLENGLPTLLTYHTAAHTLDVLEQTVYIAKEEGVNDDEDVLLLKLAALYHDIGFLDKYQGHEERSCEIAKDELQAFGYSADQINIICGLIMATKVPQKPQTRLEEIICDADLDYLGRPDFFTTGKRLYNEFIIQKIVSDERDWNLFQIPFLEEHHYFTNSSKKRRQRQKQIHLQTIRDEVALIR